MPTDYGALLTQAVWDAFLSNAEFAAAVKVGNRIDNRTDGQIRARVHNAAADRAEMTIEIRDGSVAQNTRRVFATNSLTYAPAQCDFNVPVTQQILFRLIYDTAKQGAQTTIETNARAGLLSKFPKLGLSQVIDFYFTERRGDFDDRGTIRGRYEILIIARLKPLLSTLVA